ncbi:MAG: heavy-metal-associated domain-containing protein [Bacteroidales bacterium]|jgi:copper chaperone CopZ|nr:heavy-metal-associated domain-containing protein [Bacteroidales bacterium]
MKSTLLIILSSLLLMAGGKDLRVLVMTPTPQMHCASCENKIKGNLRFEKGIVDIETNVKEQTVTVTYDARKTDVAKLQSAMKKIGYDTKVVSDQPKEKKKR